MSNIRKHSFVACVDWKPKYEVVTMADDSDSELFDREVVTPMIAALSDRVARSEYDLDTIVIRHFVGKDGGRNRFTEKTVDAKWTDEFRRRVQVTRTSANSAQHPEG